MIHWDVPADSDMYVQESGRGGRDGKLSCATILKNASDLDKRHTTQHITQHMIDYCLNKSICRRKVLFEDFHGCSFTTKGYKLSCDCKEYDIILKPFKY